MCKLTSLERLMNTTPYSPGEKNMFAKQRYNIMRNRWLSALLVIVLVLSTTIVASAQNACGGLMIFDSSDSANVPGTCVGSAADAEFYQGTAGDCSGADSYTQQLVSSPTTINGDPITDATHSIQTYDRVTSAFGPGVAPPTTMPNNKEILLQASGSSSNVYRFNVPEAVLEQSDTSRIRIDVPNPSDTVIVNVLGGGPKLVGASGFGGGGFGAWTNNGIVSTDAYSEQTANNTPYNNATQYMRTFFDHDPQKLIFNFPDATVQDFVQLGEWTSNFYGTYLAPCGDIQMKNVGHNFLGAVIADGSFGWSANNYNLPDNTPFTGETVGTAQAVADVGVMKTADVETTAEGGTVVWTIVVENTGTVSTTGGVTVADTLGANHTIVSAVPAPTNGTTWELPDMVPGEMVTIVVTTTADDGSGGTAITNDVTVDTEGDSDDTNNSSGDSVDVTEMIVGTIGDTIYHDMNGNGSQDTGEPGLQDVMVTVTDSTGMTHTATTDSDGMYTITDLPLGTTTVAVDPMSLPEDKGNATNTGDPDGGNDNMSTIELTETEPSSDMQDFGYASGSIGDTIYHDMNGNGMQDDGEPGLGGVMVTIMDSDGMTWTMETDSAGMYMFTNVPLGAYSVMVDDSTLPEDKMDANNTGDPDEGNDSMSDIVLTMTEPSNDMQDFGYNLTILGSIGDMVYHDENGNGMQDNGEPGLGDVMVTITGPDNVPQSMTTGPDGMYEFTDLPMGDYTVAIDTDSLPDDKMAGTNSGDPDGGNDDMAMVTLTAEMPENDMQDFGYVSGSIGDTVWHDANGNGVQDAGEPGIPDVVVELSNGDTATTDADGMYMFDGLPMGDYTVTIDETTLPMTKTAGSTAVGGDTIMVTLGELRTVVITGTVTISMEIATTDVITADFGYEPFGSIGDTIYHDENGNGMQDGDEPGLGGVMVTITDADGATTSMSTDTDGMYMFTDLPLGTYTVMVDADTLPEGKSNAGNTGDPDGGNDGMSTVELTGDMLDNNMQDFGYVSGSIGDLIWSETVTNSNDTFEASDGDMPLPNVTVILSAPGMDTMTMTTDADGLYMFTNLPINVTYTVTVDRTTLPENKLDMDTTQVIADPDGGADAVSVVTLNGENVDDPDQDFGFLDGSPTAVGLSNIQATSPLLIATIAMTMMLGATLLIVIARRN